MADLLTSREVQEILKVDRITVYRMLQDGRLRGVKIGHQWRFHVEDVEQLLRSGCCGDADQGSPASNLPTHCFQVVQNLFSDLGRLSAVVVDPQGNLITQPSAHGKFCQLILASPAGRAACENSWKELAQRSNQEGWFRCHAGLQYTGSQIHEGEKLTAWFIAGGVVAHYFSGAIDFEQVRQLAKAYEIDPEMLVEAARRVAVLDDRQHEVVTTWPQKAVLAFDSILRERAGLVEKLQRISEISQLGTD